ncbi:MAG: hypothetical protein HQM02_08630 [Magnetococcales bacterium]|nr:hypothetical protein [Magnetococcales bacterium]
MNPRQFEKYVIVPALQFLEMDSPAARALLLGTVAQESGLGEYLHQVGGGPALGVFQMEPATYRDIWDIFIDHQPSIKKKLAERWPVRPEPEALVTDLFLAAVMCRLHYRRVKEPLPAADDLAGLAVYWKRHYNTLLGAGTVAEYLRNWNQLVENKK